MTPIVKWNFGNTLSAGFDYEFDYMYVQRQTYQHYRLNELILLVIFVAFPKNPLNY